MATSSEIAQQIAEQNQMFMAQYAMASQIGVNPMAYGGIGPMGAGMGGPPVMPSMPGQGTMPGAFSYNSPFGSGFGDASGRWAAGGLTAGGVLGAGALSVMGMTRAGASLAPLTNPLAGFAAGRAMGLGVAGSMGVAGAAMLPLAAGAFMGGNVVSGMQQQSMLNTSVGGMNFANSQSFSGFGFGRQQQLAIGQQVRQLAQIPELLTSFEEITRILPRLQQMGAMQGVRDASEFNRRMREAITTMRDVSKVLGTSMEEASEFFAHSRRMGFLGRTEQLRNAMNARVTSSLTGMSTDQVMQLQQTGADFGTVIGGSRAMGVRAVGAFANQVGLGLRTGAINEETLQNITGKTGGEAVADVSMRFQNLGAQLAGTGPGRYILAGAMTVGENGEVGLDEELMARVRAGDQDAFHELRQRGMRTMNNRRNALRFTRNKTALAQQFTMQGGPQAFLGLMQGALGNDPDKAAIVLQEQYGVSEEMVKLIEQMQRTPNMGMETELAEVTGSVMRNIQRSESSPAALWQRFKTRMATAVKAPFQELGQELHAAVTNAAEEFVADLTGTAALQITDSMRRDMRQQGLSGTLRGFTGGATPTTSGTLGSFLRTTPLMTALLGRTDAQAQRTYGAALLGDAGAGTGQVNEAMRNFVAGRVGGQDARLSAMSGDERASALKVGDAFRQLKLSSAWQNATSADAKYQLLSDTAQKAMGYKHGGGPELAKFIRAGAEAGGLDLGFMSRGMIAEGFSTEEAMIEKQRSLRKSLGGLGADVAETVMTKDNIRQAIIALDRGSDAVLDAANKGSPEDFAKLTGIKMSRSEFEEFKRTAARAREKMTEEMGLKQKMKGGYQWGAGKQKGAGGASLAGKLEEIETFSKNAATFALRRTLTHAGQDVSDLAGSLGGSLGKAVGAFGAAMEEAGGATGDSSLDPMSAAGAAVYEELKKLSPDQRNAILASNGSLRALYSSRKSTEKSYSNLAKRSGTTLKDVAMAYTGDVSESSLKAVASTLGYDTGGKSGQDLANISVSLSEGAGKKLAERQALASAMGGGGAPDRATIRREAREQAQMQLFRAMTDALLGSKEDKDRARERLKEVDNLWGQGGGKSLAVPAAKG